MTNTVTIIAERPQGSTQLKRLIYHKQRDLHRPGFMLWPRFSQEGNMTSHSLMKLMGCIAASACIDETWEIATGYFAELGFSRANYGYTRFKHLKTIGDPDDALFLTTCDTDYARGYFDAGFCSKTALFRSGERDHNLCTWKWVFDACDAGLLPADEQASIRHNIALGIHAGVSLRFPEVSARAKGTLGLIADPALSADDVEMIVAAHRDEITAVAHMMHLRIVQLPQLSRARVLSPRQREALEWVADGKTTQDVALLMGVSAAMVEKHLRLARDALAVETTAQAVAKGVLLNMIFQTPGEHMAQAAS